MKVAALFTDYDGTIAPMGVTRAESKVPENVAASLATIASLVPVAVITSKDLSFVRPRTPFARAWACVSGLEITFDGRTLSTVGQFEEAPVLEEVRGALPPGVYVERKLASDGRTLGVSVDWSGGPEVSEAAARRVIGMLEKTGLVTDYEPGRTFVDAFVQRPDKGEALSKLVKGMGVSGNVMYMGDAPSDNPAFERSGISVGVDHGQRLDSLRCEHLVPYSEVGGMLASLVKHELEFTPPGRSAK